MLEPPRYKLYTFVNICLCFFLHYPIDESAKTLKCIVKSAAIDHVTCFYCIDLMAFWSEPVRLF